MLYQVLDAAVFFLNGEDGPNLATAVRRHESIHTLAKEAQRQFMSKPATMGNERRFAGASARPSWRRKYDVIES
jgi:hypothetical protein